jgi:hypothetical protein
MKFILPRMIFVFAFLFSFQHALKAQPDYNFKNAVLVSGSALQTGAKYKFSDVKTGVDAFVTITAQTGGISLTDIDDRSTGFDEAFQPSIHIAGNANGYVEFRIDFTDVTTGTPNIQDFVPVTCMNMDGVTYGDGILHEQDQVQFFPGNYDYLITGGKLEITIPGEWVIIKNSSGIVHPAIDTLAKDLMATVVNRNISSFLLRVGAVNNSPTNSTTKLKSVYFKSFNYGHLSTLPNRTLLSFSGIKKQSMVELKGTLSASHSYDKMIIERAIAPNVFGLIGKIDISGMGSSEYNFTFLDANPEPGVNYYRIHLVGTNTNIQEISNTLMIKMNNNQKDLALINTIVQGGNPVLSINSPEDNQVELQVADLSGRLINNTKAGLNKGINNISLPVFNTAKGYFLLIIRTTDKTVSQKIMVQ